MHAFFSFIQSTNTNWIAAYAKGASLVAQLVQNLPAMRETWIGKSPWRRERLPTPVFQPGEFHGLYSPWGCKKVKQLSDFHFTHPRWGGFPGGSDGKESACNKRDPEFDPWVGKSPWRRERLPTPVFWPREFHELYSPWGSQRAGQD